MIYVYCRRPSDSAKELVNSLGATRLRNFDGSHFWKRNRKVELKKGDIVVCWGDSFPADIDGVRILNGADIPNKFEAAITMINAGIQTIQVMRPERFNSVLRSGNFDQWFGRKFNHIGGNDILHGHVKNPDYYVQRLRLTNEFRVHSFLNKSIRAGTKGLREGFCLDHSRANGQELASPWVRSYDGGWRVIYDGFQSKKVPGLRELAHKAVKSLGLDFGAVDIGQDASGYLYVLEVNRGPGLEGGSIDAYVNAIKKWIENDTTGAETEGNGDGAGEVQIPPNPFANRPARDPWANIDMLGGEWIVEQAVPNTVVGQAGPDPRTPPPTPRAPRPLRGGARGGRTAELRRQAVDNLNERLARQRQNRVPPEPQE